MLLRSPVYSLLTGGGAKEDAIGYAKGRARFGRGEIRVLDPTVQLKA